MLVSDYNYSFTRDRIAEFPPKERDTTHLLSLDRKTREIEDSNYCNLIDYLNPGDIIILSDTLVMQFRLFCTLPDKPQRVIYRDKPQFYFLELHTTVHISCESSELLI